MLLLLMMCSLSGCVAPEDASTNGTDFDAEPPTSEAYTLTTECVTMDGLDRCWLLLVPSNLTVENLVPLVLDLHGHGGTSEGQLNLSSFAALAVSEGFIVAYPEDDVKMIVDSIGTDRCILMGSDYPHAEGVPTPRDFATEALKGLGADQVRNIMHDNGRRFLPM